MMMMPISMASIISTREKPRCCFRLYFWLFMIIRNPWTYICTETE